MATIGYFDLLGWRDRLREARFNGLLQVTDSNGESVKYKSDAEMASALLALDKELDKELSGVTAPPANTIVFKTSKGL
jgi:hypothetical protein